jgi:hypothetical protein
VSEPIQLPECVTLVPLAEVLAVARSRGLVSGSVDVRALRTVCQRQHFRLYVDWGYRPNVTAVDARRLVDELDRRRRAGLTPCRDTFGTVPVRV